VLLGFPTFSQLATQQLMVYILVIIYLPTTVSSRVPQGYVLGPLGFRVHIHDLCNIVIYYGYLLFVDDIKTSDFIISINNCTLERQDINCKKKKDL
jgi:hypothetical protein